MLKFIKRLFRRNKKGGQNNRQEDTLKKMPVSNQVLDIIKNASNDTKAPY